MQDIPSALGIKIKITQWRGIGIREKLTEESVEFIWVVH